MSSIQRYLYPCDSDIWLDSNGLLVIPPSDLKAYAILDLDHVIQLPGGILLAEGGMGKTTFMGQLRNALQSQTVHSFALGEYTGDPSGFRADIQGCLENDADSQPLTFILDGLDEAPDLAGIILRTIRQLPNSASVWISSRDVQAIRAIQTEQPKLSTYNLAPLAEQDLCVLAAKAGVDSDRFLAAALRQGILPLCAKPLGCEQALEEFRENGLHGIAQYDLWRHGVERLCDETPSTTQRIGSMEPFTLDDVLHCAAWVSLCLVLTENRFVWTGEQSYIPNLALGVTDISSARFSPELIHATLERGVFRPLGDGRITFSHTVYGDYLAALGFEAFISAEHWFTLLLNGQRSAVFPQRAGIIPWIATRSEWFLAELAEIQPELLLSSSDSIQAIGSNKLCEAFLNRADKLSYRQRKSTPISENLHRLRGGKTLDTLKEFLLDKSSSAAVIEQATAIAKACGFTELACLFADQILDANQDSRLRVQAGYAVCRLDDEDAKSQLVQLLPINPSEDPQDELRGIVLRACWPNHLTPEDLVGHLIKQQRANYGGSYSDFLCRILPASFGSSLDQDGALVLLTWALPHISQHEPFNGLGRLARAIYSFCWKWATTPEVAEVLAKGYVNALHEHRSPFAQERWGSMGELPHEFAQGARNGDSDRRLSVLEALLSICSVDSQSLGFIPYNDGPLFTDRDLPLLLEKAIGDPRGKLVERWTVCIKAAMARADIGLFGAQIDRFHELRPDLIQSEMEYRKDQEEAAKRFMTEDLKWQEKRAKRKQEGANQQDQIDKAICRELQAQDLKPERFVALASWLNSDEGTPSLGPLDLQLSPGWAKLSAEGRSALLDLAEAYLRDGDIESTQPSNSQYSVTYALTALRLQRPEVYDRLGEDVWQKCGVELLKAAAGDQIEFLSPLFERFSATFPEVATGALLSVLTQEVERGFTSILHYWKPWLTEVQAGSILDMAAASETSSDWRFHVLEDLAKCGQEVLVRLHFDSLFAGGWNLPPDPELHRLRRLAFVLSPSSYIREILDSLSTNSDWGRQWIEDSIVGHVETVVSALLSCDVDDIADLYIWLHTQYPSSTYPEHDCVYTPGPLDEVHSLKNYLITYLTKSGTSCSVAALERIHAQFPEDIWFGDCILEAKSAERACTSPTLSITQLEELCEQKNALRRLITSSQDLLDLVSHTIVEYGVYLKGDNPAIRDLWERSSSIRPLGEEDFSDHLKRYLDLKLATGVVVNREVTILRKLYKQGVAGSRTDLWVQAFDKDDGLLTLCVEVKCNWNPESKTALSDQLVAKYMAGGNATAGILLVAWFDCEDWDDSDYRMARSKVTWATQDEAFADLQQQAEKEIEAGNNVKSMVLDCCLE